MAFCTNQDVIDLTGTDLDTAIIDRLIEPGDRKIKRFLRQQGLGTDPSPVPDDLKDASMHYTAALVLRRHMVDGTLPAEYRAEGLTEKVSVGQVIAEYNRIADDAVKKYVQDQVGSFRLYRVVGRDGERVGEFDTMETAEEDET
jgi:hypothetical protein